MSQPLLEGTFEQEESDSLRRKIERLQEENMELRTRLSEAQRKIQLAGRPFANVKRQLSPLYNALRGVFEELDGLEIEDRVAPRASAVWDSWIQKLGGKQAEFIRAMLDCGHPMTSEQLRVATHTGRSTVPQIIYKLNTLGLINKNGGRFSLKEL